MSDESQLQVHRESALILLPARSSLIARGRRDAALLPVPCHKCGERKVLVLVGCVCADCSNILVHSLRGGQTEGTIREALHHIADITPGDFLAHATHGIGKFVALREIQQGDQRGDFMLIEYAEYAKLYVPLTRMDLIAKYRGSGNLPALDRLRGS